MDRFALFLLAELSLELHFVLELLDGELRNLVRGRDLVFAVIDVLRGDDRGGDFLESLLAQVERRAPFGRALASCGTQALLSGKSPSQSPHY